MHGSEGGRWKSAGIRSVTRQRPTLLFPTGRVCPDSHAFPADPARIPAEFFRSFFSADDGADRGKSQRHPENIGLLWAELHRQPTYPLDDLVPHLRVAAARIFSARGRELLLAVTFSESAGYRLVAPRQVTGPLSVLYERYPDVILAVHSHHRYPAIFSATDDADEQGFGLYGVLGRLDGDQPEVALRLGVYGYFFPLPWGAVFAGSRGAFRDANFDV